MHLRLLTLGLTALTLLAARAQEPIDTASQEAALDSLIMKADLQEVTVTGYRPAIKKEIDRITYDVQADPQAKSSPLSDILKGVPLVTVDPDGTIKVKGSTDFKIYKNGRPNKTLSNNAKDIFRALPASMIKRVEVITEPGAREDAEGTTAILNIVTMEGVGTRGGMGSVYGTTDFHGSNGTGAWLMGALDKFTISTNLGYQHQAHWRGASEGISTRTYQDTGNTLTQHGIGNSGANSGYGSLEASWEIDSLNLITMEGGGWMYNADTRSVTDYTMTAADGTPLYSYKGTELTDPTKYHDINGSINYQRLTRRRDEAITLSYQLATTNQSSSSTTSYTEAINMPVPYNGRYLDDHNKFIENTIQADWSRPYTPFMKADIGGKYVWRNNHSITDQTFDGASAMDSNTDFKHFTGILAFYLDTRWNIKKVNLRAGVRYENSRLSASWRDDSQPAFHTNIGDLVPTAAVSWNVNDANSLKVSYQASIQRPGITYLNPSRKETPTSVSYGNPDLGSVRRHELSLNYGLIKQKINLDFTLSHSFTNNALTQKQWTEDNVMYSTYDNGGHMTYTRASLYLQWRATAKTTVMVNTSLRYFTMKDPARGIKMHSWQPQFFTRVSQDLPWDLNLSCGIFYWAQSSDLYTRVVPQAFWRSLNVHFNLQKSLFKKKLNINLALQRPFFSAKMHHINEWRNAGYTGRSDNWDLHCNNIVGFFVNYRFGSVRASVKKTAKSIDNDDLEGRR